MKTKLYILTPRAPYSRETFGSILDDDPWDPWYDKAHGFVIRAESEDRARELAAMDSGDEGSEAWMRPNFSICELLENEGAEGVILQDFAAA